MQRLSNSKSEMHMRNCKQNCGVEFFNLEISLILNLSKIYSTEFFLFFPVSSSSVCNKKILIKIIWGHRLGFYDGRN